MREVAHLAQLAGSSLFVVSADGSLVLQIKVLVGVTHLRLGRFNSIVRLISSLLFFRASRVFLPPIVVFIIGSLGLLLGPGLGRDPLLGHQLANLAERQSALRARLKVERQRGLLGSLLAGQRHRSEVAGVVHLDAVAVVQRGWVVHVLGLVAVVRVN